MPKEKGKKYKKTERLVLNISLGLNIAISVLFTVLLVFSIFLVRNKILQNTDQMATSLAKSSYMAAHTYFDSICVDAGFMWRLI